VQVIVFRPVDFVNHPFNRVLQEALNAIPEIFTLTYDRIIM
jgi:hypothetical protein